MPNSVLPPDFGQFAQWTASKFSAPAADSVRYEKLLKAARAARDDAILSIPSASTDRSADDPLNIEVLQLLAASSLDDMARPPELVTARGFRVTLAYDDGVEAAALPICVLVECPAHLRLHLHGRTPYLWNGTQRFELGQFDADGKAIGALPEGVAISIADFASGKMKLEEPDFPT
jgi:hypothetical protein